MLQQPAMTPTTTLTMVDGVRIVVPDSLHLITPYVLREQLDWFEDEIRFLRRLLQPGQRAIDIGANYGVYTLSIARTVGTSGRVWAFEPASSTAELLRRSIAANGFSQVVLEQSAVSSAPGSARLSLHENSELNALVHDAAADSASETVPLVTLDECRERHAWRDMEFLKIDAEGEEASILKGGKRFFAELSPLVQYEIKAGNKVHLELARDFAALGYDSYRLVPGLDLLVPFDAAASPDGYLLNLFCCKRDRADRLAARGFLLASDAVDSTRDVWRKVKARNAYRWRHTLARMPYATLLAPAWEKTMAAGRGADVEDALALYALSRDSSVASSERFRALEASFELLMRICEHQPSHLRLVSLARVARDYGARATAAGALQHLSNAILEHNQVDASEPFLAPGPRFDSLPPGAVMGNWVLAGILEELELAVAFSSFYSGLAAHQRLELIRAIGLGSEAMDRRLRLLHERFGSSLS